MEMHNIQPNLIFLTYDNSIHRFMQTYILRAGLSIPEALGKLSKRGPLPSYVEDQKKKKGPYHHLK